MHPTFEIPITLEPGQGREPGQALYRQLREAIAAGRLVRDTKLPATRDAKPLFGVSRNTLAAVYERLISEGYAVGRHGSGTYVAWTAPAPAPERRPRDEARDDARLNPFWLSEPVAAAMNFWRDPQDAADRAVIDMRPGLVDLGLFPFDVFRSVAGKQLRKMERGTAASRSPQGNRGNFRLREAITAHVSLARAVACSPDDVLVTSGAQQAFDLIARVLVTPGRTVVAVEDPGYPPMRVPFAAAGAQVVPVPVDGEGLVVDALPRSASVICLCPSHQYPLGVTMSKARREQLIRFARANGATIVEDDYDGEFRWGDTPVDALRTLDHSDVVIYVGTFSKCMFPSLRLGYLIAPAWASKALVAAKNCMDWHCPVPMQTTVAEFIAQGHLRRHVRKMRAAYHKRQRLLLDSLRQDFAGVLHPIESQYGMHLSATVDDSVDVDAIAAAMQRGGVNVHTLSRYFLGAPTHRGLVFGYGSVGLAQIRKMLSVMAAASPRRQRLA
jgi:GntR family transcriptional regulator/MocR family aminotransferase